MRIKVGMKVEALITEAASNIGAWRAGEVVWGNGHSYVMRWSDGGPDSERISRKFVRPSPPDDPDVVRLPEDLGAGDIVELFDGSLWKWVEVVRFVGGRQLDVKFVGSTEVVTADRSALRPRLIYGEKGWALIHKNDQIPIESAVPSRPIAGKNIKTKPATNYGIDNGAKKFAAQAVKLGKTKRGNYPMDADIVRDVKRFHGNSENTNRVLVKREEPAARYDDGNIEVMDVHPSHYLEKRQETGNNADCFLVRRTENDKDDDDVSTSTSDTSSSSSDSSSSSSSSGSNNNGGDRGVSAQYCQENQEAEIPLLPKCEEEEQDSDNRTASARMQHHPVNEAKLVMKQDEQEEQQHGQRVHDLELEAYMSVLKVFHATGPLTWTKEELLCDLRLHLHVSSDEHMQVIWRLNGKTKPASGPARNGHR